MNLLKHVHAFSLVFDVGSEWRFRRVIRFLKGLLRNRCGRVRSDLFVNGLVTEYHPWGLLGRSDQCVRKADLMIGKEGELVAGHSQVPVV